MPWWLNNGLIVGAVLAACIFIFGPALVGAFDLLCWFATASQCTTVVWNDWRILWALMPVVIGFFALLGGP